MFGQSFNLFEIFGFKIKADYSWILLALLITWSLADGFFPFTYPYFSAGTYWLMAAIAAVGIFASIVFHELAHSLVARRFNLPIDSITLFIFGGVASMKEEPPSPKAEFYVAIAGPLMSLFIALFFYTATFVGGTLGAPLQLLAVTQYLWFINVLIIIFNLIPAFPLDGGRVLRAALWQIKSNLPRATRITSRIGSGFGLFLIVLGIVAVLMGNFISGVWYALIGAFLRNAARMSYKQLLLRRELEGEAVDRFMKENPIIVPPEMTVGELVQNYFYNYLYTSYPVVDNGKLLGYVSLDETKNLPHEEWDLHKVREILVPATSINTITADTDAMEALAKMNTNGSTHLLVAQDGHLAGIVTLKDLLRFFSLKLELEEAR